MTRNELKELIRQIVNESFVRPRDAVAAYQAKQDARLAKNLPVVKEPEVNKSDDEILIQKADAALKKLISDFELVTTKYNELRSKIDDLDVRMSKREPNETDEEYIMRQRELMIKKNELIQQSMPYAQVIVKMNKKL